jgi:alkylation response protein AidB-like acyl-CoA dehydrogenase
MSGVVQADWYTVFAKTAGTTSAGSAASAESAAGSPAGSGSPGSGSERRSITAFIVDRSTPGVEVGTLDRKMGVRGVDTGELLLHDVAVPDDNVIGEVGGFRLAMLGLNAMRPLVAARGIGLAEGALMYATEYAEQRAAFGQHVADFQGIQWEVARLAAEIEAARLLTYRAASYADQGRYTKEWVPFLSIAKYYATELAVRASGVALQMLGAAGYMKDHLTELYYRDAKQLTIVEGTTQIQLGLIARGVRDRDLWWD